MTGQLEITDNAGKALDLFILDDEDLILEIVERFVGKLGKQYCVFNDPVKAMNFLCQANPLPRFVLIDFYMPGMSGIDFLSQLKTVVKLDACTVFICSGIEPPKEQVMRLHKLGARFLDKSVITDRHKIAQLLSLSEETIQ